VQGRELLRRGAGRGQRWRRAGGAGCRAAQRRPCESDGGGAPARAVGCVAQRYDVTSLLHRGTVALLHCCAPQMLQWIVADERGADNDPPAPSPEWHLQLDTMKMSPDD
jgi:hypothetical protein